MMLIHGNIINLVSNFQSALTEGIIPKHIDVTKLITQSEEKVKKFV